MARTSYETNVQPFLKDIREWVGYLTIEQVARKLGIGRRTLYKYIDAHEELKQALEEGRKDLIEELKSTLKQKAKGFHYTETKKVVRNVNGVKTQVIEEYEKYSPPDTGAIHLLLKNIDDEWRNDDKATIDMKKQKLEIEREKTREEW